MTSGCTIAWIRMPLDSGLVKWQVKMEDQTNRWTHLNSVKQKSKLIYCLLGKFFHTS
jgi:hypothetical protein